MTVQIVRIPRVNHTVQRACGAALMVLLCDVCAMSILIPCLYDEGTNKVWAQETVAQHESSTLQPQG